MKQAHPLGNTALRTPQMWERYCNRPEEKECFICKAEPVREFKHWKIITNDFPYDVVAEVHHMLVPKEHVVIDDISYHANEELIEIRDILEKENNYDCLTINLSRGQSFKLHGHVHLIRWKRV